MCSVCPFPKIHKVVVKGHFEKSTWYHGVAGNIDWNGYVQDAILHEQRMIFIIMFQSQPVRTCKKCVLWNGGFALMHWIMYSRWKNQHMSE